MQKIEIAIDGNDFLCAHLFNALPEKKRNRSVIVGPATAVSQTYYFKFCSYLAEHGFDVLSFDFRGVGQSRNRSIRKYQKIGFSEWAMHDYPAVIDIMKAKFSNQPLYIVGHSVGGWMPGATYASAQIDGILGAAALSAYWPLMAKPNRYAHMMAWYFVVPLLTRVFGYWPGWAGLKANLSASLGQEFARWAKHPEFVFSATTFDAKQHAKNFSGHLHLLQIADDPWGTPQAVSALLPYYPNAKSAVMESLRAQDFGLKAIGHLNFFRSTNRETLWPLAVQRLTMFG